MLYINYRNYNYLIYNDRINLLLYLIDHSLIKLIKYLSIRKSSCNLVYNIDINEDLLYHCLMKDSTIMEIYKLFIIHLSFCRSIIASYRSMIIFSTTRDTTSLHLFTFNDN